MIDTAPELIVRPTRAAALRQYASARGSSQILGLRLGRCPTCDAHRIADHLRQLGEGARRVGALKSPDSRYEVFTRAGGPLPVRLIVARAGDGTREIVAADWRPPSSPPPRYLGELDLLELEEELKAMDVRLMWEPLPLAAATIDTRYAGRRHLIYIPVSPSGTPLKVGETVQPIRARYPSDRIALGKGGVADKYWVARVLVKDTRRGHAGQWIPAQKHHMQDVEHLVARRLSRGGATLPLQLTRMSGRKALPLSAVGPVKVGSPLPPGLAARYPDRPKEAGVVPARLRNNIALAPGDSYETAPEA